MDDKKTAAFMSYAHIDDKYGHLTEFCKRVSHEVQVLTGEEFPIFQDRKDILWGQNWRRRIEESLDDVTFLIPIITPSFFKSQPCRNELQQFVKREKKLKRDDLILPVYYVDCPLLSDDAERAADELAQVIAARQWEDWRDLRHHPWDSPQVRKALERLAVQIRDALGRVQASIEGKGELYELIPLSGEDPNELILDPAVTYRLTSAPRTAHPHLGTRDGDYVLVHLTERLVGSDLERSSGGIFLNSGEREMEYCPPAPLPRSSPPSPATDLLRFERRPDGSIVFVPIEPPGPRIRIIDAIGYPIGILRPSGPEA